MEAFQLNQPEYRQRYASKGINVSPNPPQVGIPTTIELQLQNPGPGTLTVTRIEMRIAQFGMGVAWEELPTLGPFQLPADPAHIEKIVQQWTPQVGGHRCVRANIFIEQLPQPLHIGRNLHIIEAETEMMKWHIPFHLGNPDQERKQVILTVEQNNPHEILAIVMVKGSIVRAGEPIWLEAGEEVEATLLLRARTRSTIASVNNIEARIDGHLIDGIQIIVQRPAQLQHIAYHSAQQIYADTHQDPLLTVQR